MNKKLQRLCGEYRILKHELVKKKLEIITQANKTGLMNQLMIQMEW